MAIKGRVVLAASVLFGGLAVVVRAEDDDDHYTPPRKRPAIVENMDNFTRNLFSGLKPKEEPPPRKPGQTALPKKPSTLQQPATTPRPMTPVAPRAGSAMGTAPTYATTPRSNPVYSDRAPASERPIIPPAGMTRSPRPTEADAAADGAPSRPLHERLSTFRNSAFPDAADSTDARPAAAPGRIGDPRITDPLTGNEARDRDPISVVPDRPATVHAPREIADHDEPLEAPPAGGEQPTLAQRPGVGGRPARTANMEPTPAHPLGRPSVTLDRPRAVADNLLVARKGPILSVETVGPRRITVGKEAVYQLQLVNAGEVAAEEVVVHVNLPQWADVLGSDTSAGSVQIGSAPDGARPLAWRVGQVNPASRERMALRLVPRESRPFDLGVRWDYKPAAAQAMIEVQEPKLAMHLEGPREVLYGRKELFALKLANAGTGDAESVVITLLPVGTGDNQPATHRLGTLPAGQEKTIEVELTARQTGDLLIQVEARGDNGVQAALAEKVLVRRAGLQLDVAGPQVQFVNAVAAYRVRVSNPGNAPARNLRLALTLPTGAKYLSGVDGARQEPGGKVQWLVDSVGPASEQVFVVKCQLSMAGPARLDAVCQADDELSATAAAATRVDAVADLALDVKDPSGPVAVGEDVVYEIRIRNRGTKAAEGVEVLSFFSTGVEPVAVEGTGHKIQPGQVIFNPIAAIGPGAETTLRVKARADQAGTHVFRAEVHCKPLGTRLVSEETTQFYQEGPGAAAPMTAAEPRRMDAAPGNRYAPPPSPGAPPAVNR
jgi:hypothetical protein